MADRHPVYTEFNECQDCYRCVRQCAAKAIKVEDNHASVLPERCVMCGDCVLACPVGAKKARNDLEKAIGLIQAKEKVIASIAPSFISEFPDIPPANMVGLLKWLGFWKVSETALGAQEVSAHIAKHIETGNAKPLLISTACPAIVEMVKKHQPELVENLAPFLSPVLAHCKMLKNIYGEAVKVVFIGPCIAKKHEADLHPDLLAAALTFSELKEWINRARPLDPIGLARFFKPELVNESFEPTEAEEGRLYPIDGGMIATIKQQCSIDDLKFMSFSDVKDVREILNGLDIYSLNGPLFLELLACKGGCINGPATDRAFGIAAKKSKVALFKRPSSSTLPRPPEYDITAQFSAEKALEPAPAEADIISALRSIGKFRPEDELNCAGCGYDSCRAFAKALVIGKTEPQMCVSFMRRSAQQKANLLLKAMPSGVVIVDKGLKVVECNKRFAEYIGEADLFENTGLIGADLKKLVSFYDAFESALEDSAIPIEQELKIGVRAFVLNVFPIESGFAGGILQDTTDPAVQREAIVQKAKEYLEQNAKAVQQIAHLIGENAAHSEALLKAVIDAFSGQRRK